MNGIREVGLYPHSKSPFGIMDLSGNVQEWVKDYYAAGYPELADQRIPDVNPQGPIASINGSRVVRGAPWYMLDQDYCHSAFREESYSETRKDDRGFRIVARKKS